MSGAERRAQRLRQLVGPAGAGVDRPLHEREARGRPARLRERRAVQREAEGRHEHSRVRERLADLIFSSAGINRIVQCFSFFLLLFAARVQRISKYTDFQELSLLFVRDVRKAPNFQELSRTNFPAMSAEVR